MKTTNATSIVSLESRALAALEWSYIQSELSYRTVSRLGLELASNHKPYPTYDEAKRLQTRVTECIGLLTISKIRNLLNSAESPLAFFDIASRDGCLTAQQIYICGHFMQTVGFVGSEFRAVHLKHPSAAKTLYADWNLAPATPSIVQKIFLSVNSEGGILDTASSELARLRRQIRDRKQNFENILDSKIKTWNSSGLLQDSFYDVIDGRYVVPVKVEQQSKIHGVLHGKSNTGQSVFIEPIELTSLNNELKETSIAIQVEEYRILKELTDALAPFKETYSPWVELVGELDLAFAAALLATDLDLSQPVHADAIDLEELFHPALKVKEVIKNSFSLPKLGRSLVISGPNTGGKTVLLKAAGVAAMMASSGLPVAAKAGSKLPHYRGVIALIGDEQNIAQGLSSFSAQIKDMREVLSKKDSPWLILIDEILSSTAPEEASALAQSFVEEFMARGHHVILTTHFADLSIRLKQNANVQVCGMEFKNGLPTYRMIADELGSSHALEVAERLGVSKSIIQRARSLVSNARLDYEEAKKALRKKEEDLKNHYTQSMQILEIEKKQLKQNYESKIQELQTKLDDFFEKAKDKLEGKVEELTKRLQAYGKMTNTLKVEARLKEATDETLKNLEESAGSEFLQSGVPISSKFAELKAVEIVEGAKVMVLTMAKAHGIILEVKPQTKTAVVQVGNFRAEKKFSELAVIQRDEKQKSASSAYFEKLRATLSSTLDSDPIADKLDLRGKRLDEALSEAQSYIDRAFRANKAMVTIVTGHGTGAIKNSVKDLLNSLPYIKEYRPEHSSNDGAFIVEFDH